MGQMRRCPSRQIIPRPAYGGSEIAASGGAAEIITMPAAAVADIAGINDGEAALCWLLCVAAFGGVAEFGMPGGL